MNIRLIIIGTVVIIMVVLVVLGAILALGIVRRKRSKQLQVRFGGEYDYTVQALGDEKKAQTELEQRQKHVESLDILPLSASARQQYLADWEIIQTQFVDEPGQAILKADQLIMEVMKMRAYPVANFEQRAADISVTYPALVSNYRAAQVIVLKNQEQQADTEELRQALIYFRSLFKELLDTEAVVD